MPSKSPLQTERVEASIGVQSTAVKVYANVDGTGTAVIPEGTTFVSVTATAATHIVRLPAPVLGTILYIKESSAVGFEVIPQAETQYINGTLCDSAKELAFSSSCGTGVFICTVGGSAGKRTQYRVDEDGTLDNGGTPD